MDQAADADPAAAGAAPAGGRHVRDMTEQELPWMAQQEHEIFGISAWSLGLIKQDFRFGAKRYRVVEVDGVPVAYAVYGYDGDAFHLMNIAVSGDARGHGHGRVLMDDFLTEARNERAREVWLEVAVTNVPALALYRAFGFTDVRVRRRYYQPEGVDAIVMRAEVPAASDLGAATNPPM